jgi:sugar phosphate isomerase/epimerase
MASIPFGIQLYTVRDHMEQDPAGTLQRVKEIGYDYIEAAGYPGGVESFKTMLDDAGLTAISSHVNLDELTKDATAVIAEIQTLDVNYAALSLGGDSKEHWDEQIAALDAAGAKCREAGITLCYHNHAHEFELIDGVPILDYLYTNTSSDHVGAQIDTYWVQYGNADPVEYINKYADRCPLLHMKDMSAAEDRAFAEMGAGILDWPAIIDAGKAADVAWYIVEQDTCPGDSLESAAISAKFMQQQ